MIRHQSNLQNVLKALDSAEERALTAVGEFGRSTAITESPVRTGAYRDSHDYRTDMNEKKVMIGNSIDYAIWIEEGSSRQRPQHVIRKSVVGNIAKIQEIIKRHLKL